MWAEMAQGNPYDQVDHMYLIRGHTYLPNDRYFAQIEKYKKKCEVVLPHNYDNVIKEARTTQPFMLKKIKACDNQRSQITRWQRR